MSTDYTPTTAEDWMPTDMQVEVAFMASPVRKQRRVHGESINVTTWLHTGDVLMSQQKQKKGRIVRIERIIYNDDLTCTYVLEPVSGAHVRRRVGGRLTVRPMRYTTHTHENTVRGQYFRISTGEKRVL